MLGRVFDESLLYLGDYDPNKVVTEDGRQNKLFLFGCFGSVPVVRAQVRQGKRDDGREPSDPLAHRWHDLHLAVRCGIMRFENKKKDGGDRPHRI